MDTSLFSNMGDFTTLDFSTIILNNVVAVAIGLFIMFTYWLTYSGTAYSKKFDISLGMLVLITTMVMCALGNNVALSLGLVDALSIIRFRTAVKDVRDAVYLFWCIAAGICCGVSQYALAAVSSAFLFVFLLCLRQFSSDGKVLLIVRSSVTSQNKAEADTEATHDSNIFSSHLPILSLNTQGQQVQKDTDTVGILDVYDYTGGLNYLDEKPSFSSRVLMHYRGNSSYAEFDKMSYRITFLRGDSDTATQDVSLLGMAPDSDWVLNGLFLDRSLLRNRYMYHVAREIMPWAPDTRFCEVFVDGSYEGVYLVIEPIQNTPSRLNLNDFGLLTGETA